MYKYKEGKSASTSEKVVEVSNRWKGKIPIRLWEKGEKLRVFIKKWKEGNDWLQLIQNADSIQERLVQCTIMLAGLFSLMFWDATLTPVFGGSGDFNVTYNDTVSYHYVCTEITVEDKCYAASDYCYWYENQCRTDSSGDSSNFESLIYVAALSLVLTTPALFLVELVASKTIMLKLCDAKDDDDLQKGSKEAQISQKSGQEQSAGSLAEKKLSGQFHPLVGELNQSGTSPADSGLVDKDAPNKDAKRSGAFSLVKAAVSMKKQKKQQNEKEHLKLSLTMNDLEVTQHSINMLQASNVTLDSGFGDHESRYEEQFQMPADPQRLSPVVNDSEEMQNSRSGEEIRIDVLEVSHTTEDSGFGGHEAHAEEQDRMPDPHGRARESFTSQNDSEGSVYEHWGMGAPGSSHHKQEVHEGEVSIDMPNDTDEESNVQRQDSSFISSPRRLLSYDYMVRSLEASIVDYFMIPEVQRKKSKEITEQAIDHRFDELLKLQPQHKSKWGCTAVCRSKTLHEIHELELRKQAVFALKLEADLQEYLDNGDEISADARLLHAAHWDYLGPMERRAVVRLEADSAYEDEDEENSTDLTVKQIKFRHFVGWTFMTLYCFFTAYYICLFGIEYGASYTNSWLSSFFVAFCEDLLLFLPFKIVIFYVMMPDIATSKMDTQRMATLSPTAPALQAAQRFPYLSSSKLLLGGSLTD